MKRSSRITIKDLAKQLKISTSTVSRALRDHHEIKAETKKAVLELAKKLDYQPNEVSLSLLKKKTKMIGVVVPKMGYHFFSAALDGIEAVTQKAGYTVMVCQTNESYEREVQNIRNMAAGRVDGVLVSVSGETKDYEHFRQLQRKGIPLVFFDRECKSIEASRVLVDNYGASCKVVEHLAEMGCKKIAYLGGPHSLALSNTRLQGYKDTLERLGLPIEEKWEVHCDVSRDGARIAAEKLIDQEDIPDAIFAMSDRLATTAMGLLKERNIKIPDDIAVVGFNNEPIAPIMTPSLTSVKQSEFEIGQLAAEILLNEIDSDDELEVPISRMIKTELIIRESSKKIKS
ncbi:LacI family DNA-binding transcriptional regulator [Flexithrix dorotheae]|uniref:LacI family DNA-binding transcriptional regulator n=1 Tax=Flexithrix dorotheae TaxID=70993 RepID=UPI00037DE51A|nr:LacI family DNA-binding transcriptional regulator [Flexithrix dorotheae]